MNQELENDQNQQQAEQEEAVDPIALLAERLGAIESALGIGESSPSESNLLSRLNSIENNLGKSEREKNLPKQITWSQLGSLNFMRKNSIRLEDINSGKIQVVRD